MAGIRGLAVSESAQGIARGGLHGLARAFLAVDRLNNPPGGVTDNLPASLGWGKGGESEREQGEEERFHANEFLGTPVSASPALLFLTDSQS